MAAAIAWLIAAALAVPSFKKAVKSTTMSNKYRRLTKATRFIFG